MKTFDHQELTEICEKLSGAQLPRWRELPDLALYMDQVLALIERYLGAYPGFDKKGLTASMVNNYVKLGVMPPPTKKKYGRSHLMYLIIICVLKPCLPMAMIRQLIEAELEQTSEEAFYDRFCGLFETSNREAASDAGRKVGSDPGQLMPAVAAAALRAQAEQALAQTLLSAAEETEKPPRG